jgi:hypothetical protein
MSAANLAPALNMVSLVAGVSVEKQYNYPPSPQMSSLRTMERSISPTTYINLFFSNHLQYRHFQGSLLESRVGTSSTSCHPTSRVFIFLSCIPEFYCQITLYYRLYGHCQLPCFNLLIVSLHTTRETDSLAATLPFAGLVRNEFRL